MEEKEEHAGGEYDIDALKYFKLVSSSIDQSIFEGSLAILTAKHLDFFLLLAKGVCNMTNTDQKENIIGSNLLSLASSEWIIADVFFISAISKCWLNPHMKWYQGSDRMVCRPGFLSLHRSVRFFLMIEDLDQIRRDWRTNEGFEKFSKQVELMTNPKLKHLKEGMVEAFLKKMRLQVQKHNKRYILTRGIIRSVFAEWQTGQVVAQVLKGGEGLPLLSPPFFSKQHDQEINCEKFLEFLKNEIPPPVLEELRTDLTTTSAWILPLQTNGIEGKCDRVRERTRGKRNFF